MVFLDDKLASKQIWMGSIRCFLELSLNEETNDEAVSVLDRGAVHA